MLKDIAFETTLSGWLFTTITIFGVAMCNADEKVTNGNLTSYNKRHVFLLGSV